MPASFAYGRKNGRYLHVSELDEVQHRGRKCGCVCPECGRPLEAHLGQVKAWHFQHQVEDVSCNPQPMTLLHAFVRDELASRRSLCVPAVKVRRVFRVDDLPHLFHEDLAIPAERFAFANALAECRGDGVQPDVVYFEQPAAPTLALEVKFTHAVDAEKLPRLRANYAKAVEFDVSDLPASGITRAQLETELTKPERWKWLVNDVVETALKEAHLRVQWQRQTWRPMIAAKHAPDVKRHVSILRKAADQRDRAEADWASIEHQALPRHDRAEWLGEQDQVYRVTVACFVMKLHPMVLPPFMSQALPWAVPPVGLQAPPCLWQPLVFMKYCHGKQEVSGRLAAPWCQTVMPDLCRHENGTKSRNGFTRTEAALQEYFLLLEAQGLLAGEPGTTPEGRMFKPLFRTFGDMHVHLQQAYPAFFGPRPPH